MKRTFVAILPVVIVVNHFSLWPIVSANVVVKKTKTEWPVLEPTLSRLGEEKTFYGYFLLYKYHLVNWTNLQVE